jgi:carboxyl-terminal processing protease
MNRTLARAARALLGLVIAASMAGCDLSPVGPGLSAPAGAPAPPPTAVVPATLAPPTATSAATLVAGATLPAAVASAAAPTSATSAVSATHASPAALAYLTYAVDYVQEYGLHSDQVDWPAVRARVFNADLTAQTPADTYPAIQYVLTQLPVHGHSSLRTPSRVAQDKRTFAAGLGLGVSYAARKVVTVDSGSPAERAGIRGGDTIDSLNGVPVASLSATQFFAQIYLASGTILGLRRGAGDAVIARLDHEAFDPTPLVRGRRLPGNIGYVAVPGLPASPIYNYYADIMQQIIADIDQTPTCGWVVDLQGNAGGYFWPMLAGIGAVLGEGKVGSIAPLGDSEPWAGHDGAALMAGQLTVQVTAPNHLRRPNPPVAVLTDGRTASAAEFVTVAFRGRPNTSSFGEATWGVPTYNSGVPLADGAVIGLTEGMAEDRTGRTYDAPIPPDVAVGANRFRQGTDKDPVLQAGVAWLRQQPACAGP